MGIWLVCDWERYPGRTSCYLTKTARAAARRCWPQIKAVCKQFGIAVKYNESALTATFPNGYTIWCTGAKDKGEADKIRGEAAGFQKIAIDEPATFESELLEYILTEVADPCLMQTMGELLLCGTPGPIPEGMWYDICTKMGWYVDTFTALDNPFLPNPKQYIEDYLKSYGYTHSTPKVLREIYAQWVLDTEALVYINDEKTFIETNGYFDLPLTRPFDFVTLGVDLGYAPDPCAFVVAGAWYERSDIWVPRAYTKGELTPDLIAGEIRSLEKKFRINQTIVDAGGGGLTTAKALELSYGLNVSKTPKGLKRPKIDLLRGAINSNRLRVHLVGAQPLVSEFRTVLWNDDRTGHNKLSFDHCVDGTIQALLPHKQFTIDFKIDRPDPNIDPDKAEAYRQAQSDANDAWANN